MFVSTNSATSWTAVAGLKNINVHTLNVIGGDIFANTDTSGIFFSADNGANWTAVSSVTKNSTIQSIAMSGNNIYIATDICGVLLSTNNGSSWATANSGLPPGIITSLAINNADIYAGTWNGGIFLSPNNGTTWAPINSGLPENATILSLAVVDSNIFAGTWGAGVWRRPLSEVTSGINSKGQILSQKSTGFKLTASAQSKRNIAIIFSLAQAQPVSLKVYSLSGREISTLVNSSLGAGEHSLLWDTKGMAAGCYVAKMKVGSSVIVKNILVSW